MAGDIQPPERRELTQERRGEKRAVAEIRARLDHPDGHIYGLVVDISFGGAKFVTETITPELSTGIHAVLTLTPIQDTRSGAISWNGTIVRSVTLYDLDTGNADMPHAGPDTMQGNDGNDDMYGGGEDDTINGNANADYIEGNGGADTLYGDAGQDVDRRPR